MSIRRLRLRGAAGPKLRTETYMDVEHLVVPIVALVEGVIWAVNAETPELVLAEEIAIAPAGWNGRPCFVDHPSDEEANKISGNNPETLETKSFGILFNADPPQRVLQDKKLRFEAWLNREKSADVDGAQDIIARLEANDPDDIVEVSVGVFIRTEDVAGEYEGQPYEGIWRNIVPDHLALLPKGMEGACSVEMGCGAPRVASVHLVTAQGLERIGDENMTVPKDKRGLRERLADLVKFRGNAGENGAMSDADLRNMIDTAIRAVEPGYWGIDSVYPDQNLVVYSVMPEDRFIMYQRGYTITDNTVTLNDDRTEVEPVLTFTPVAATSSHQPPTVAAPSCGCATGGNAMTRDQRIAALITNSKGRFVETDRTWLANVPEERLKTLEMASPDGEPIPGAPTRTDTPPPQQPPTPQAPPPQAPPQQPPPRDAESYFASLPKSVADSIKQGMRIAEQRKQASIKALKDTNRCKLTDAQMNEMTQDELDNLMELAGVSTQPQSVDFSVNQPRDLASQNEVQAPPDFFAAARTARSARSGTDE